MIDEMVVLAEKLRTPLVQLLVRRHLVSSVQGAVLAVDRFWWEWACERYLGPYYWCRPRRRTLWMTDRVRVSDFDRGQGPEDWDKQRRWLGMRGRSPFVIRVMLWNEKPPPRDLPDVLDSPTDGEPISLLWERRDDAVASSFDEAVAPLIETGKVRRWFGMKGFSVGGDIPHASGTLGGILRRNEDVCLVSCAHVLGPEGARVYSPGPHEGRNSRQLGTVRYSIRDGRHFTNKRECGEVGPQAPGSLDLAVARADEPLPEAALQSVPFPKGIRLSTAMAPYDPVCFVGKESGASLAEYQGVSIYQCIRYDGGEQPSVYVCFGRLLALQHPNDVWKPAALPGDSGSWVIDPEDGLNSWHAMIIGGHGPTAYATFAEDIISHLDSALGGAVLADISAARG